MNQGNREIKCALIGCGYWGSKLKRYIKSNPHFVLKYACNSRSDLNKVWKDGEVEAVVVATPNETHYRIVKDALLHNKHVMSEKPLALRTVECEALKQIAEERNLLLLTEYTYTFSRALKKSKDLIEGGWIGRLLGMEMSVRHLGRFYGGSVYWLLASHMLSVLDMFVPLKTLEFTKTDIVGYEGNVETGVLTFRSVDLTGLITISLNYPGKEARIIFYGEKGSIIYNPVSQPSLQCTKYDRIRWTTSDKLPKETINVTFDESNNLRYALEYFYDCIQGKTGSNIDRAIEVTRIIENVAAT